MKSLHVHACIVHMLTLTGSNNYMEDEIEGMRGEREIGM